MGFIDQANWWKDELDFKKISVDMVKFTSIPEFIGGWNAVTKSYDMLMILSHGGPGTIDCNGGYLGADPQEGKNSRDHMAYNYSRLTNTINATEVCLFSCHGADVGDHGLSAAEIISSRTNGAAVWAAQGSAVNYKKGTGLPQLGPGVSRVDLKALWTVVK